MRIDNKIQAIINDYNDKKNILSMFPLIVLSSWTVQT